MMMMNSTTIQKKHDHLRRERRPMMRTTSFSFSSAIFIVILLLFCLSSQQQNAAFGFVIPSSTSSSSLAPFSTFSSDIPFSSPSSRKKVTSLRMMNELMMNSDFESANNVLLFLDDDQMVDTIRICMAIAFMVSKTSRDIIVSGNEMQIKRRTAVVDIISTTSSERDDVRTPPELRKTSPIIMLFKFMALLILKGLHDAVYYPSIWLEEKRSSSSSSSSSSAMMDGNNINNNDVELQKTSPITMLMKLLGVLILKGCHDAVYYPKIWIEQSLMETTNEE